MVLTILLYYYISSILCEKGGGPACRATIAVPHYIQLYEIYYYRQ